MTDTLDDSAFPDWLPQYKAALLELDHSRLRERIAVARKAITVRMLILAQDHGGTPEERQAMTDALSGLAMLEVELATARTALAVDRPLHQSEQLKADNS